MATGAADDFGVALGGVDAADLGGIHLNGGALFQIYHGLGIHDFSALAVAVAVVLFAVLHAGVLAHIEGVDAVVAAFLIAAVVDAAAGHDVHIAVLADEEVVVDHFVEAGLGDDDGDMAGFAHRAVLDADVDAGLVCLIGDLDILSAFTAVAAAVLADVEGAHGLAQHIRDLFQQFAIDLVVHHKGFASFVRTGQPPRVSARIWGRMSAAAPRWRSWPSPTTMTSSAKEMMRSWWEIMIMVALPV